MVDQVKVQTYYFGMFSLMPETFMDTSNGLRKDIAEAFYEMKPSVLRFPGETISKVSHPNNAGSGGRHWVLLSIDLVVSGTGVTTTPKALA